MVKRRESSAQATCGASGSALTAAASRPLSASPSWTDTAPLEGFAAESVVYPVSSAPAGTGIRSVPERSGTQTTCASMRSRRPPAVSVVA